MGDPSHERAVRSVWGASLLPVAAVLSLFLTAFSALAIFAPSFPGSRLFSIFSVVLGAFLVISVIVVWGSLARRGADQSRAYVSSVISDLNPNPVMEVAKEGKVTYMNEAARRLFPDLPALAFAHPCLQGLENVTDRLSRDCHADDRWYHQDAVIVPSQPGLMRLFVFDITDRKSAETKQRESANILRNFLEGSSDIIFVKDRALRTVLCNTVFADMIGKRPEDIYGMKDQEMGWPADLVIGNPKKGIPGWGKDDLAALNGEIVRSSPELVNIGGKNRYFDTLKLPLRDETGAIIGLLGIARDITERIALQENLEKERTLLLTLVNSLPDIVFVKDNESRFLLANRATAAFLGARDPADLIGKTDFEFVPREVAERFLSDDRLVIETGASLVNKDEPARSAAGSLRWLLTTKVPLRDETGEIRGLVGIGHDITARKQAEQKLRQQTTLLDIASDAIVVRDMQNIIQYWNKSAEKVYGWTAEEAVGRSSVELLYSPRHIEEASLAMAAVIANGEWSGEMHHQSKAGQTLTIEARWTLVRNEAGAPSGILAVNTNVTEKRTMEAQLLRVQRLESLGTLAGGVAHDLNNVLTPILMGVEGLSLQHQDEHTRRILEIIRTATQRGANIVQQVLSFARGVTGERTVVQLKHALREVQNIIQETFPRSIEIRGSIDRNLWPVQGDVTQLHQVLMNLCVNARDAMPQGGILSLAAENVALDEAYARMNLEAKPIRYVVLKVEDDGIGMAPEVLEKIFDPFFTTKEPGKGTGLGLSTTRSIVKTHQGFITVYSEVGKGSSFHVYIPAAGQGLKENGEKEQAEIPRGNGELILIVDDEEAVREITQQMLETYGYRVLSAGDGTEAMAVYVENRSEIRVMITDMMMPYMDGAETIRAVRKIEPTLKIIATSGLVPNGNALEPVAMGVQAFLAKPFTAESLLKTLQEVLHPVET